MLFKQYQWGKKIYIFFVCVCSLFSVGIFLMLHSYHAGQSSVKISRMNWYAVLSLLWLLRISLRSHRRCLISQNSWSTAIRSVMKSIEIWQCQVNNQVRISSLFKSNQERKGLKHTIMRYKFPFYMNCLFKSTFKCVFASLDTSILKRTYVYSLFF